jgi:hypothetical protein
MKLHLSALMCLFGLASSASVGSIADSSVSCPVNPDGFSSLLTNPNDNECTTYYHCVGNVPFLARCPDGLYFDAKISACSVGADCGKRHGLDLNKIEAAKRAELEKSVDNDTEKEIDVVCPHSTDGFSVFVPYPYDCSMYYHCVGRDAVLMHCPADLHFDTQTNVCNWPVDSGCTPTPRPTQPPATTDASGTTEESMTTEATYSTVILGDEAIFDVDDVEERDIDVICPLSNDGLSVFVPYPYDCNLYYHCVGSTPILRQCPDGLYFDTALETCNWPEDSGCTPTLRPTEQPATSDPSGTTEESMTTEATNSTENNFKYFLGAEEKDIDVVCPLSNDGFSKFVPYPYDCTLYYHCVGTTPILRECPDGLHFDTSLETCNWPEFAGCTPTPTPTEPPATTDESGTTEASLTTEDSVTTQDTNLTGIFYGDFLDEVEEREIDVICPLSNDGYSVFVPYPYDCNLYYHCVGSNPVLRQCPDGLHFDMSLETCNWPEDSDCSPTPRPTEPPATTDLSGTTEESMTTDATNSTGNNFQYFLVAEEKDIDVVCPLSNDGFSKFVPYPYDCTLYYHCVGSTPILRECPDGLHFDTSLETCNWPEFAGCTPTPKPTDLPATTDASGTTEDNSMTTEEAADSSTVSDDEFFAYLSNQD